MGGIGTRQREASTSCFSIASAINLCTRSVGWPESDDRKNDNEEEGVGVGQVVSLVFVRVVEVGEEVKGGEGEGE